MNVLNVLKWIENLLNFQNHLTNDVTQFDDAAAAHSDVESAVANDQENYALHEMQWRNVQTLAVNVSKRDGDGDDDDDVVVVDDVLADSQAEHFQMLSKDSKSHPIPVKVSPNTNDDYVADLMLYVA